MIKKVASKRVGMRKGRVGTNELSGKYICLGDKKE